MRYQTLIALGLWFVVAPPGAQAQEISLGLHASSAARSFLLPLREAARTSQPSLTGLTFARLTADGDAVGMAGVPGAQRTPRQRSKRSLSRKLLGALVGAAGGFFAGGYLGATIEGDRCDCDDPGLKGALIGAPVGAVAGGILGARYLF